jgi:formylglycine-generating enzyme required for sulfatase activity
MKTIIATVVFVCVIFVPGIFAQSVPDNMVRINGGTFMMGSPENDLGHENNETQHQVTISSFYIGKYEVTQKEYEEIMGINPSEFKGDNLPVENVSWYDAIEYCNRRSQQEGLSPAYTVDGENVIWKWDANGYRLPTEAEWEYACRAGTTTPFYTGDFITTKQANYNGEKTMPVGSFTPNDWGLYDMHGNIWEWCWDRYGNYPSGTQTDPTGAVFGGSQVVRGGSWRHIAPGLRSAFREYFNPYYLSDFIGFRLVRQ